MTSAFQELLAEYEASQPEWMRQAYERALQYARRRLAGESAAQILGEFQSLNDALDSHARDQAPSS